jgi:hypothetical protein
MVGLYMLSIARFSGVERRLVDLKLAQRTVSQVGPLFLVAILLRAKPLDAYWNACWRGGARKARPSAGVAAAVTDAAGAVCLGALSPSPVAKPADLAHALLRYGAGPQPGGVRRVV